MNYQLIIVIGLPGSGKTTFCQDMTNNGYLIFDDFISHFFNGELIESLSAGNKLCICDPRLCIYDIFLRYMTIFEKYINKDNIQLVLFENNPKQCCLNIEIRNDNTVKKQINQTIVTYSKIYHLDNYQKWNHIVLEVYSQE